MLILAFTVRRTSILLEKGLIAPLSQGCVVRREFNNIGTRLGCGAHRRVHETQKWPQGSDDEFGHVDKHLGGVCSQRARIGQVAGVNGDGCKFAQARILVTDSATLLVDNSLEN